MKLLYQHGGLDFVFDLSNPEFLPEKNKVIPGESFEATLKLQIEGIEDKSGKVDKMIKSGSGLDYSPLTSFIKKKMFKTGKPMSLDLLFWTNENKTGTTKGNLINVEIESAPSDSSIQLANAKWLVVLSFQVKIKSKGSAFDPPILLYPKIKWDDVLGPGWKTKDDWDNAEINAVLKDEDYTLTVEKDCESAEAIDKVAETISTLGTTIASRLTNNINTSLQPSVGNFTPDLALWLVIQQSTEDLSFNKFKDFMDVLFCEKKEPALPGKDSSMHNKINSLVNSHALPFMGVDAYQSIKVATEAFVMVNCMTSGTIDDETVDMLNHKVTLKGGKPNTADVKKWWDTYRKGKNGVVENDDIIPYLQVIQKNLSGTSPKTIAFAKALDKYAKTEEKLYTPNCYGIIQEKLRNPCFLELIWSYWHEESMMVQGLNAIGRRFQNIKGPGEADPLAQLNIDPLRPLSNLLWGYLQDEQHRLTVRRRAYEYDHHYGITLQGTAVQNMRFADSRSKFIEAFHTLLNLTSKFYKQADDMTVQPDAFPILNALKEVHLVLSEGAHNQYGDLPSVARAEMLMQQWLLARPEFREFLPTRIMVAYPEDWMPRVAAINNLMGWTKTNVMHFRDLGRFGEKLLLSIRFGNWADITDRASAGNWANFWRSEIQSYMHAYRAVTGVDLTVDITTGGRIDAVQPSVHLQRRLLEQRGKVA